MARLLLFCMDGWVIVILHHWWFEAWTPGAHYQTCIRLPTILRWTSMLVDWKGYPCKRYIYAGCYRFPVSFYCTWWWITVTQAIGVISAPGKIWCFIHLLLNVWDFLPICSLLFYIYELFGILICFIGHCVGLVFPDVFGHNLACWHIGPNWVYQPCSNPLLCCKLFIILFYPQMLTCLL